MATIASPRDLLPLFGTDTRIYTAATATRCGWAAATTTTSGVMIKTVIIILLAILGLRLFIRFKAMMT